MGLGSSVLGGERAGARNPSVPYGRPTHPAASGAPWDWRRLAGVNRTSIRWVGVAVDCADAGPVARFYQRLLGFESGDFDPPNFAQLWDPAGGVHLNIQGEPWYEPPTWPETPGEQAKMLHLEVEVDDLEAAVATALEAGGTEAPWQPPDRDHQRLRIILDPAGHPLCLFLHGE
jgi:catechol 2,3-dioxygenase-like lactoylglutathione lyase family enzyme